MSAPYAFRDSTAVARHSVHREFIAGAYDGDWNVRNEERRMTIETEPSLLTEREEQTRRVPMWLVVLAVLALGGVVELIVYGYIERPGWIGVANKKFWHYLDLLIVPVVIAGGVAIFNWMQSERERKAEAKQQERERVAEVASRNRALEVENQRAQDEALQAYLDQMSTLL